MKKTLALILTAVMLCLLLASCSVVENVKDRLFGDTVDPEGLWADATYSEDKEFGNGAKTIQVEVKVDDKSVTFTIKTDAKTLGDALLEHDLIAGESGAYGLYVKTVNGILADYDVDQSYWAFYENGDMMMTGADGEDIFGGEHYEIVYTK